MIESSKLKTRISKLLAFAWWLIVAVVAAMLLMRFGLRAVGVRDELPVPSAVYALTNPLVEPFYRYFPLQDARFDYHVVEAASLAAAGVVVAVGLALYAIALLLTALLVRRASVV